MGFFDSEGKWATVAEVAREMGFEHENARENIDHLADIDILRVRRNPDGEPVTAQLTNFAVDLFEAQETDEVVAAYVEHGKEPPMDVREQYMESLREAEYDW